MKITPLKPVVHPLILIVLFVIAFITMVNDAGAQEATWTQVGYNWMTEAGWNGLASGDSYPGTTDYDVTLPGTNTLPGTLSIGLYSNISLNSLSLLAGAEAGYPGYPLGDGDTRLDIYKGSTLNAGNLTNFTGTTLSQGKYVLFGGTLKFNGADIHTLAASTYLYLAGSTAQILNLNNENALAHFANNLGQFSIGAYDDNGTVTSCTFTAPPTFTNAGQLGINGAAIFNATALNNTGLLDVKGDGAALNVTGTLSNFTADPNLNPQGNIATMYVSGAGATLTVDTLINNNAYIGVDGTNAVLTAGTTTNTDFSIFSGLYVTGTNAVLNAGDLTNFDPVTKTLSDGNYVIGGSGTLKFDGADIHTLASSTNLYLVSASASIEDQSGNNALEHFANNEGDFSLQNDASFTASLPFTNSGRFDFSGNATFNTNAGFTNTPNGNLEVWDNGIFTANSLTNNGTVKLRGTIDVEQLTNYDSDTKTLSGGGSFSIYEGLLKFDGADIQTLGPGTSLGLLYATSRIQNESGGNALTNFKSNQGSLIVGYGIDGVTDTVIFSTDLDTFTNGGNLQVNKNGELNLNNLTNFSGTTLSGGSYYINGGKLKFIGADLETLAANTSLSLNGASAQLLNQTGDSDGLHNFTSNLGEFTFSNLFDNEVVSFTTAPTFTNTGVLHLWGNHNLNANEDDLLVFNANNLMNFTGTTLSGGTYDIGNGQLKFIGADIQTLATNTSVFLDGPEAQILNQTDNSDGLDNFTTNLGNFSVSDFFGQGFNFEAAENFTNSGTLYIKNVVFNANNLTNFSSETLTGGTYNIWDGTLKFNDAHIHTLAAGTTLALRNGATVLDQGFNDALADFSHNLGTFAIGEAMNFTLKPEFINSGVVQVGKIATFPILGEFAEFPIYQNAVLNLTDNVTNSGQLLAYCPPPASPDPSTTYGKGIINLNAVTLDQTGGGTLEAGEGGIVNLNGATVEGGTITTTDDGMVNVANGLSYIEGASTSGSIRVDATGQLEFIGEGGSLGGTITNYGSLTFNPEISDTFAGVITGTGTVTKQGSGGILVMDDANTYTGPTTVAGGMLIINGSLNSSTVTVNSGATVGGGGSLANLSILSGGIVAPGNSIGTLTVNGNYTQQGAYQLEFRAPADLTHIVNGELRGRNTLEGATLPEQDADLIHVLGAAALAPGSVIQLQPQSTQVEYDGAFNAPGNTDHLVRYLILRANAGRTGRLALLSPDGLSRIDYPNATDVELVIAGNTSDLLIATAAPAPMITQEGALWQNAVYLTRQRPRCDESFGARSSGYCAFAQGDVTWSDTDAHSFQPSGSSQNVAGLVGFGKQIQNDVWLGVAAGAGDGKLDGGGSLSQSSDITQVSAYLWGQWKPGLFDFRGWLGYIDHSIDGKRHTTTGDSAHAEYDADQTIAIVEARRWWQWKEGISFAPMMGLQGTWYRRDSYRETGSSIENFSAQSGTYDSMQTLLGMEGRWLTKAASLPLQLETHLGWAHEFGDTDAEISGVYVSAPETKFTNSGVSVGRDQLRFRAQVSAPVGPGVVSLGYEGNYSSNLSAQGAMVGYSLPF